MNNDMAEGLGGSYVLDPKTQTPVLIHRTKDVDEAPAAEPVPSVVETTTDKE